MKEVIDLNGETLLVPDDTIVRTGANDKCYLLTQEEVDTRDLYLASVTVQQKQYLYNQIDAQQRDILSIWDGWASKSKAHEDDTPWVDVVRYEIAKSWSKDVRAVNDTLSVDSDTSVLEAALVTLATLKETGKNI